MADTKISIDQALKDCKAAGNDMVPGARPIQSELKKETSLVGMAYLNYIYQNDIANRHFCESMLLMSAQVPAGTKNLYTKLFTPESAQKTPLTWRAAKNPKRWEFSLQTRLQAERFGAARSNSCLL